MAVLDIKNIRAGYDEEVDVIKDLSIAVGSKECVALIGANGAGKSSLLKVLSGVLKAKEGSVLYKDTEILGLAPHKIVDLGIIQVPEEGGTFASLTIEENLNISCRRDRAKKQKKENLETVYGFFPVLREKRGDRAGNLSGGQRKMLSIGKAIMESPDLLLLDDISMGLAPKVVEELYEDLKKLTDTLDIPVIIVEQIVEIALDFAQRGYVMTQGEIAIQGTSQELLKNPEVKKLYIGM